MLFVVDGGGRTVACEYLCGWGKGEQDILDRVEEGFCVASGEVGTSYGALEEGVASP